MMSLASLMNLAGPDLMIIFLIILVLFGAKRLPDLAKGMGQAIKEFHKAKDEFSNEIKSGGDTRPVAAAGNVARPVALEERTVHTPPVETAPAQETENPRPI
ncbi:MAG: twin-arginine translocase TatA/TatE family subunit [Verrucomicrobiota bacterium]|nr:twin-arginine translocase TatA/TatE family subunit [Verrucomicrobiota bacterium]